MSSHLTTEIEEKDNHLCRNNKGNAVLKKHSVVEEIYKKGRKAYRSMEIFKHVPIKSPLRRTISYNMALHVSHENIKLWNF
jgi:hypothetical protein